MFEGTPKQFASAEEEVQYLRERIAASQREMLGRTSELDHADYSTIAKQEILDYGSFTPKMILDGSHALDAHALALHREDITNPLFKSQRHNILNRITARRNIFPM